MYCLFATNLFHTSLETFRINSIMQMGYFFLPLPPFSAAAGAAAAAEAAEAEGGGGVSLSASFLI